MTVAAEKSVVVEPRPRLSGKPGRNFSHLGPQVVKREDGILLARVEPAAGARTWPQDLLAHKGLLALSSVFILVALLADYFCGTYVTFRPVVKVPDLLLDRIPPVDFSFLFTYGYMTLIVGMFLCPLLRGTQKLHVVAIQFSLLLTLRSVFMIFTHVGTPAGAVAVHFPGFFSKLYFENDMFFSGHTAMPFLGFYLFRRSRLRYVYLVGAIVMGMVVLAMHVHYSIDVLAAFFMTYASYQMGSALLHKLDPAGSD